MKDTFHPTFSLRHTLAHVVGLASPIIGLYLLWQIVPFFRGQITSPLVTAFNIAAPFGVKLIGSWNTAFNDPAASFVGYYLVGAASYIAASGLVMVTGQTVSRILFGGWLQFRQEQHEVAEAERLFAIRERRRERRLAALRGKHQKSDDSTWIFLVSAAIFWWML